MCTYPSVIPCYDMLTTLSVFEDRHSSWLCVHLKECYFPKLRVFTMQHATSAPLLLYQFVHRHPTLMEVNISLHPNDQECSLWLPGLEKLIDGTGTWRSKDAQDSEAADVIGWPYDTTPSDRTFILFTAFAFARVPLHPDATQWRDPHGSPHPRYMATELALDVDAQDEWESMGFTPTRMHGFLATMSPRFPALEVLRLG